MKKTKVMFFLMLGWCLLNSVLIGEETKNSSVTIDWTKSEGKVNRGLFSTQGFMQVYVEPNPMVLSTFLMLNPKDTCTRLETYINRMEPQNDNDDPNVFDKSKFKSEQMIRFIDNKTKFLKDINNLGMEPLVLLCYLADWLKSGDPNVPIKSIPEWVEFACAVIEDYNGSGKEYKQNLRYVEIWNEPNMQQFYTGTMQSYFDLFDAAADRIHKNYPGVMVGGPALTHAPECKPDEWMSAFMQKSAKNADYISYHAYGEPVDKMVNDAKKWVGQFRQIPGKENGKMMLTETDYWVEGWPKFQYIMERQFKFMTISDIVLSIHHFCCLAYNESGNYTFGIVDQQGGVMPGIFWSYWLFRNYIGENAHIEKNGTEADSLDLCASHYSENGWIGSAVFHNKGKTQLDINANLKFPKSDKDRILEFDRCTENLKGIDKVIKIPAGTDNYSVALNLTPGEGLSLNLKDAGKKIYNFADINNQETPWLHAAADKQEISFTESTVIKARLLNTTYNPINGKLQITGFPKDWKCEILSGKETISNLNFGEAQEIEYRITAASALTYNKIAPYVYLVQEGSEETRHEKLPHSIPCTITVVNPISLQPLPLPVYGVKGEKNKITLQINNLITKPVDGKFEISLPEGLKSISVPSSFSVKEKSRERYDLPFEIANDIKPGKYNGKIRANFMGAFLEAQFDIEIVEVAAVKNSKPLDISKWANIDGIAYDTNRVDFTPDKIGIFIYPGDFTPSGTIQNIRGIPFRFMDSSDKKNNAIMPEGQMIDITPQAVKSVTFLGYGYDGKHPGTWKFHYEDGTVQSVGSQVPEWCTPPPDGFEVACKAPYRYIPGGPAPPSCELFMWSLMTDSTKKLKCIELPEMVHAHIYAITLTGE